ncbi:MAG: hypothetical protein JST48_05815 [Bacteroidetes bacterium]|nr:hypothetical protein [Bacteroidota bacterium]
MRFNIQLRPGFFLSAIIGLLNLQVAAQTEAQQIAPELVGKWCFINLTTTDDALTNSCLSLNSDGTYEATLDRASLPGGTSVPALQDNDYGKWWVSGNRIFYQSNVNGQGSFVFQKINHPRLDRTPMIVINGVGFASASGHEPW